MKRDGASYARLAALSVLERHNDLFAFQIDGWSAWRVLRNPLYRMAEALPLAQPARANTSRVIAALAGTVSFVKHLLWGRQRDCLVKTCRSGLRIQVGDHFRDVYFDGVLATGNPYFKLEEINSPDFEYQASRALFPSQLDPVVFTFWGMALACMLPVSAARPFCDALAQALQREVGLTVSSRWLLLRVSTAYWQSRLYTLLLKCLRPKVVLVSDTGEYAIIIACKRMGIKLIELQHGVFDAMHPDAIPVWANGSAAQLLLPDILACRGDYWVAKLAGTRQGRDHARAVGCELIDLARERRRMRAPGGPVRVVLSSQGLDSERLAQWCMAFVAAAPAGVEWALIIKLHPVYDAKTTYFDALRRLPRVQIISGYELPNIYDLLADADLHLSIASACHFDAAALGVPSGIIPLTGHECMLSAVDNRFIHLVLRPEDAWSLYGQVLSVTEGYRFSAPDFVSQITCLLE